jgi:preprotein translocase subunit YajC
MDLYSHIAANTNSSGSAISTFIVFALLIVVFYFLLIRPQRSRMRQQQELMRAVNIGDEVETVGGIYGKVVRAEDDILMLEIAPGTTVKVSRGAVRRRIYAEEEDSTPEA